MAETSGPPRESPRISVIIPVFNGERFLGEAIESALSQTLPPYEILVI
ncbi:MAG TPA: glycosyltransferase, partial [Thermogutta sp.]|nr:glycosyltransferase [Thermogutta sp.]